MTLPESPFPKTADGRPIVPLSNSPLELVFMFFAGAGVAAGILAIATTWSQLPQQVPSHFGLDGKANAYSDKMTLLLLPAISLLLVSLVLWIGGKPHLFNYPWKITDENAPRQYRAARVMMRLLGFIVAWVLAYLTFETVQSAIGASSGLNILFLIISLVLVFGTILTYIIVSLRLR